MYFIFLFCNVLALGLAAMEVLDEPVLLDMLTQSATAYTDQPIQQLGVGACQGRLCGEKTIIVLRIDSKDGNSAYCSEDCAWKAIFGPELQFGLQPTLDAATREASYGQMWFNRSKSAVVTVMVPDDEFAGAHCKFGGVGKRARDLARQKIGSHPDSYDFVYHFLPSNMRCNFGGVAFLHGKHAFSAPGYARNGIIKHEVGHNYGLGHNRALGGPFGTPGKEDGWDTGSSMGGGVIFGTADRYMLGWISGDALQDVGEFPLPRSGEEFGNPKLLAYWDRGDCGHHGNDHNVAFCGGLGGQRCFDNALIGVDSSICQSGQAKRDVLERNYVSSGCEYFWYAKYVCTGPTTTTKPTTTSVPDGANDVLLTLVSASRHSLKTTYGKHAVVFSLWKDAVFTLTYRTPHGTDGAMVRSNKARFGWVADYKVNLHRLYSGRNVGRGALSSAVYAGLSNGQTFTNERSPLAHRGNFTVEVCSADENQAIVSLTVHGESKRRSKCPQTTITTMAATTTVATSVITTTLTTTITTWESNIPGLTLEEAAVYNPQLASYWDLHHCGKASDDHHWAWCGEWANECRLSVVVEQAFCPSGVATLNFTKQFAKIDGCTFAYFAQYVCHAKSTTTTFTTTKVPTTTTSTTRVTTTSTSTTTTSSSTAAVTTTSTTTSRRVQGLTPEEAAMYNPDLSSYWDLEHCGKATDNHNMQWCPQGPDECRTMVDVDEAICKSQEAELNFTKRFHRLDQCVFAFYAQYVCIPSSSEISGGRRLRGTPPSVTYYSSPMASSILEVIKFFGFGP